jgi:hypothetical protein
MALFWMAGGNYGQEGQREIIAAVSVAVFALRHLVLQNYVPVQSRNHWRLAGCRRHMGTAQGGRLDMDVIDVNEKFKTEEGLLAWQPI